MKKIFLILLLLAGTGLFWAVKSTHNNAPANNSTVNAPHNSGEKENDDQQGGSMKLPGYRIMKSTSLY